MLSNMLHPFSMLPGKFDKELEIFILVKLAQSLNAQLPIVCTVSGIVMFVKALHFSKA